MELKELTKYSSFLKKYEYLEEDFSSKKDFKNILNYYKASISKVNGAKKIKKDISEADNIIKVKKIFESNQIWN